MRVPDYVTETVGFLAPAGEPGRLVGTAFMVAYPLFGWERDEEPPQPLEFFVGKPHAVYLVTARHVIDKIGESADDVLLRVNADDGSAQYFEIPLADWQRPPNDPHTGFYRDVAVSPFERRGTAFRHISLGWSALPNRIADADIGIGDDVFFPGLFRYREGRSRNIPILRKGTLAAMVQWDEPVNVPFRSGEAVQLAAHLVETRSIGGLSGSPVFAHPAGVRDRLDGAGVIKSHGHFFLLGLMSGHYDERHGVARSESLNTGIGYVTPVETIVETLDMDELETHRETAREQLLRGTPGNDP